MEETRDIKFVLANVMSKLGAWTETIKQKLKPLQTIFSLIKKNLNAIIMKS